jgi:hypothetical protein
LHAIGQDPRARVAMQARLRGAKNESKRIRIFAEAGGISGCQTKMILGRTCASPRVLTVAEVRRAISILRHDFAFVGLTEDYDESVCLFHRKLGGLPAWAEFLNVRPGRGSGPEAYDEAPLAGFVDVADEALYAAAKQIFEDMQRTFATEDSKECPQPQ